MFINILHPSLFNHLFHSVPYSNGHTVYPTPFQKKTHPTPRRLIIICPTFPIFYSIKKTENLYRNNSLRFSRNFTFITSAWRFPFPAPIFRRCYLKKNPNGYVLLKIQIDPSHSQLFPQPQALPGPILCQGLHCLHPRKQGPSICWSDHLGARHGVFVRTGIIKNK